MGLVTNSGRSNYSKILIIFLFHSLRSPEMHLGAGLYSRPSSKSIPRFISQYLSVIGLQRSAWLRQYGGQIISIRNHAALLSALGGFLVGERLDYLRRFHLLGISRFITPELLPLNSHKNSWKRFVVSSCPRRRHFLPFPLEIFSLFWDFCNSRWTGLDSELL
ncbi:unnamed protein product, partial [Nesidiocoris tenuis]